MLNGKQLILATRPFAKENRAKSWMLLLSTMFIWLGLLAGTLFAPHWSLKLLCSIFAGFLIVRMFVIYHDHQHHAILNKSVPAQILMTIYGLYNLAPSSIWKRSHDYHHKHNSKLFSASIGSYPIVTKRKFMTMTKGERRTYLATRHPLTILGGYFSMFLLGMCVNSFLSSPKKHFDSLIAIILHLAGSFLVTWFFGWQGLTFFVLIPFSIACAIGAYLFYAQHNFPGVSFADNTEWAYEKAAIESSSFMKMNFFWRWVTANIGYHHIHHLNSRIPFYRLPEVMAHFKELQEVKTTTLNVRDIVSCLRLKIWDPEKNELLPLSEVSMTSPQPEFR
jgi:acyl-lipid omega-6 desaturase (Delta-12 desaturase)